MKDANETWWLSKVSWSVAGLIRMAGQSPRLFLPNYYLLLKLCKMILSVQYWIHFIIKELRFASYAPIMPH